MIYLIYSAICFHLLAYVKGLSSTAIHVIYIICSAISFHRNLDALHACAANAVRSDATTAAGKAWSSAIVACASLCHRAQRASVRCQQFSPLANPGGKASQVNEGGRKFRAKTQAQQHSDKQTWMALKCRTT